MQWKYQILICPLNARKAQQEAYKIFLKNDSLSPADLEIAVYYYKDLLGGSSDLEPSAIYVSFKAKRKNFNPLHNVCIHLISRVFHLSHGGALKHISHSGGAESKFHNNGGTWGMSCFQSKDLAALFTPLQYPYHLIKWGGFWRCDSCYIYMFKIKLHFNANYTLMW